MHRWTAEEGRHAYCIRDYLLVTRGVDPVELERARMEVMATGYDSDQKSILHVLAYVSIQELATRISHRNTGRYAADPICERLLSRVATDENLHMVFYRNLVTAALKAEPGPTMRAITDEIMGFDKPEQLHNCDAKAQLIPTSRSVAGTLPPDGREARRSELGAQLSLQREVPTSERIASRSGSPCTPPPPCCGHGHAPPTSPWPLITSVPYVRWHGSVARPEVNVNATPMAPTGNAQAGRPHVAPSLRCG